jgi:hypothetical protein
MKEWAKAKGSLREELERVHNEALEEYYSLILNPKPFHAKVA